MSSDVLGLLLERVTKQPLDEVLRRRVFEPLRMSDTGFFGRQGPSDRLTCYYSYEDGQLVLKESRTNSPFLTRPKSFSGGGGWPDGYAGLLTTAVDWWRLYNTYFFIDGEQELVGILLLQTGPWNHLNLMEWFNRMTHQAISSPEKKAD